MLKIYLFIFIIFFSFSCRKANDDKKIKTLYYALTAEIDTLDPARSYDTVSGSIIYQAYETLYEYHYLKRPYILRPLLAESMPKISKDGTKYTIKIKKNIPYHDDPSFKGKIRFVKSIDFVNQIKRLAFLPCNSNGYWLFEDKIIGFDQFRKKAGRSFELFKKLDIEGLKTPDDHTLVIELTRPSPQLIYALAMTFTTPLPMEAIEFYKNIFNKNIVGTGPFKLKQWGQFSGVKLERYKKYRDTFYPSQGDGYAHNNNLLVDAEKKIPFLDEIHFNIIKESQTRWLNFRAKKIDLLVVPKDNYNNAIDESGKIRPELKAKNIKLQISPTLTYWWISFNMKDPILGKNRNLRYAIAHAINIDKFIKVFTNSVGQKANTIYPPGIPGYDSTYKLPFTYNLDKAKEYLKEAGYPGGKNLKALTFDVRGSSTKGRQMAEYIKNELGKIGIKIKIMLNTFPAFLAKSRKGQLQIWQDGWAMDYPDSENSLQLLVSKNAPPGPNASSYSNPKFDKLFDKLKVLPNNEKKFQIMREMENIVQKDLPWVMQFYSRINIIYHNHLKNYRHSDLINNYMKYLKIEK